MFLLVELGIDTVETEKKEEEEGNGFQKREKRKRCYHLEKMKKVFGYGGSKRALTILLLLLVI